MRFVSTGYAVNNLTFLNQEKIDGGLEWGVQEEKDGNLN